MGAALTGAGIAVATVRTIVRDLIAMAMSELTQALIRWAAAALITMGLATPGIIADGIRLVVKWAEKVSGWIKKVVAAVRGLSKIIDKIFGVLDDAKAALAGVMPKAAADTIVDNVAIGVVKNLPTETAKVDNSPYATR